MKFSLLLTFFFFSYASPGKAEVRMKSIEPISVAKRCKLALNRDYQQQVQMVTASAENFLSGSGEVKFASLKSILQGTIDHPGFSQTRALLQNIEQATYLTPEMKRALLFLRDEADLSKVFFAVAGSGLEMPEGQRALFVRNPAQPGLFTRNGHVEDYELYSYYSQAFLRGSESYAHTVILQENEFINYSWDNLLTLAHELMHASDIIMLSRLAAQGNLPEFLVPRVIQGTVSVSAPHLTKFLEMRTYSAVLTSMIARQEFETEELEALEITWFNAIRSLDYALLGEPNAETQIPVFSDDGRSFDPVRVQRALEIFNNWPGSNE